MHSKYGRLTLYGNTKLEVKLESLLDKISEYFKEKFSTEETQALLLIGGYGRGEGGVLNDKGVEKAHNNFDIIYVYKKKINKKKIEDINKSMQELGLEYEIGIDIFATSKAKLLELNGLVISYDMRFGHKLLYGDDSFLKAHTPYSLENINALDIRQLLVNRGTLLLINRLLLQKDQLNKAEKKTIIKHNVKAIIGFGDALLFFHKKYHWSYLQKQKNMASLKGIDKEFQLLYEEAIKFRFYPQYDLLLCTNLRSYHSRLTSILEGVHLQCERKYLQNTHLQWKDYLSTALNSHSKIKFKSLKDLIKGLLNLCTHFKLIIKTYTQYNPLGILKMGSKHLLSLSFPFIMYEIYPKSTLRFFMTFFKRHTLHERQFTGLYLQLWARYSDVNFINLLNRIDLNLGDENDLLKR